MKKIILILLNLTILILANDSYSIHKLLLEIPSPDQEAMVTYQGDIDDNCQVVQNSKVMIEIRQHNDDRKLNFIEGIYYGIDKSKISNDTIEFNLSSLRNIIFIFTFSPSNEGICKIKKSIRYNEINYDLIDLKMTYKKYLGLYALKLLKLKVQSKDDQAHPSTLDIWPYQAKGYMPLYDFKIGLVMNVHSNIRPNDQRTFNKSDPIIEPIPLVLLRYGPLFVSKEGAGSVIFSNGQTFTLLATFFLEGEPFRGTGYRPRKQSIYFGPFIKTKLFEILYYRDVRSISHGEVFKIFLAPEFEMRPNWILNPRIYYQYWDQRYVDYYFGIDKSEANSFGKAYQGKETHNFGFMIRNVVKFKTWQVFSTVGVKFYGKEVYNSPIVTKKREVRCITGIVFNIL